VSHDSPAERVAHGARLLDQRMPGWAELIDLNRLNMRDFRHCVLAQTWQTHPAAPRCHPYDAYPNAVDDLSLRGNTPLAIDLGMYINADSIDPQWAELDELWTGEIRKRTGGER
jgi:hypothetical protein